MKERKNSLPRFASLNLAANASMFFSAMGNFADTLCLLEKRGVEEEPNTA